MATLYDIDLLRALFVDKLNDNTIFLASFYEQIKDDQAIVRYVDTLKELIALQNQEKTTSNYKAMGVVSQSGSADIVNITQNYVAPFEYQVRFDIQLEDRDYVLGKLKTLINEMKGKKYDLVLLDSGSVVVLKTPTITSDKLVPTNYALFTPTTAYDASTGTTQWRDDVIAQYYYAPDTVGVITTTFYIIQSNKLYTRTITRTTTYDVPNDLYVTVFTYGTRVLVGDVSGQYKLSLSFNGVQSQEPYINNGLDRVWLFFGGNATIVDKNVGLGNDIIKFTLQVGKDTGTTYTIEPTEIPASLAMTDDSYQTYTTANRTIDRNFTIDNKVRYTIVYDRSNDFYNNLYKFARFGSGITDINQIYTIKEYRYANGTLITDKFYAKLGEVQFANTNGDVMTITTLFKVGAY